MADTPPTDMELRRFIADCTMRRRGWAGFQAGTRRAALRMARTLNTEPEPTTTSKKAS